MPSTVTSVISDSHGNYIRPSEQNLAAARASIGQDAFNRVFEILYAHRVARLAKEAAEKEQAA